MEKAILVLIAMVMSSLWLMTDATAQCNVSDKEALTTAKNFCRKVNVKFSSEPVVRRVNESIVDGRAMTKQVEFGEKGQSKGSFKIGCNDKDVVFYLNSETIDHVWNKYSIPKVTTKPHNWPAFLSENEAKEIMLSNLNKIGMPQGVEFAGIDIDKQNGRMSGRWVKKYKGFPYEGDGIIIGIMAVDGEFVSYSKSYYGKPCPTEVNVNKAEAIKEGWKQIERLFGGQSDWNRHEDDYEIKSAELKIVQPNVLAGRIVSRRSPESRLAWVIEYKLKDKLKQADSLLLLKMKIDAGTRKFLGGDYSR
ncbi:MAG: hypothetical protein HXX17_03830 [Geobacteraceae bacterium]|nr:hypothetical protein [Geobacteraceae bacterium]